MEMLISFSSRTWHLPTLTKVPKAGSMTMVQCYCAWLASKLAWPEPYRKSMVFNQEEDKTPDPTMLMTWRPLSKKPGLHYTWAVPRADCLHATPHWCSNSCKRKHNQVLSVLKWTYFSEACHFCLKYPFLLILCNILIFSDTEFWGFIICKP